MALGWVCVAVALFISLVEGGSCPGVCQSTSVSCSVAYKAGMCSGPSSYQCCEQPTPSCTGNSAQCQDNSLPCSGTYASGLCPGSSSIQCCQTASSACGSSTLFTIDGIPVQKLSGDSSGAFYYASYLQVDADGSPNAYNPSDTGIDYLADAGSPGNWYGLSTDSSGNPYIQGKSPATVYTPFPGYYVSTTALIDSAYSAWDPRRFANAVNLTYFVLPGSANIRNTGVKLGDLAYVYWDSKRTGVYAIYADVGPANKIGEASVGTHKGLGNNPYNSRGKAMNGISSTVHTLVFPGSGTGKLLSQSEINSKGETAFNAWGGSSQFSKCILGIA